MEFKHVKIGVCLDLNKVKMVRHIRFHDSEEVYLFNPDGYDPEAHYKHLQERIKSFKCSKGKPAEIDWYLFPPYLSDYVNESNAFVFNGNLLARSVNNRSTQEKLCRFFLGNVWSTCKSSS